MSVMDRLINAMKINDDSYDDYEEDEDIIDEDINDAEPDEPERPAVSERSRRSDEGIVEDTVYSTRPRKRSGSERSGRDLPAPRSIRRKDVNEEMEVCIMKPTSVNDARQITNMLLAGNTVVLNLEGLDTEIAQRIIDFTSGSCYAVQGNVMKISNFIFVITPSNVDISGDAALTSAMDQDRVTVGTGFNRR